MKQFPDESKMERSEDGSEPIRGGSIGFNRILNGFVDAVKTDTKPRWNGVMISAFTIFRNVWSSSPTTPNMTYMEDGFVKDINLFLDYFDTYLSLVWSRLTGNKFIPVVVYFPDYHRLPKELEREFTGKNAELFSMYNLFIAKHGNRNEQVKKLDHSRCFWIRVGDATYPHKELARKFREIASHQDSLYTSGDSLCLITHIPLDLYISSRLSGVVLLESYTAKIRKPNEFRFKLDKEGRVPFQSFVHVALGDSALLKPQATLKMRKQIIEDAVKDRWLTRGDDDILRRVSKITGIPSSTLKRYDFI